MLGLSALFVLIWSTGFIVGRAIVDVASPNLFLTARFLLAALLFGLLALQAKAKWPSKQEIPRLLGVGALLNGLYLAGGYWAVSKGLSPAIMALLGALQPLFTTLLAIFVLNEKPARLFWLGLLAGIAGVVLVLLPALNVATHHFSIWVVAVGMIAVLSLTVGTVLQKTRIAQLDLRVSSAIQNLGGAMFTGVVAVWLNESRWEQGTLLYGALAWAALVLSGAGTGLLLWLVRKGKVAQVATLMYLAPPLAAIEAYYWFDARLTAIQLVGFAFAALGVWVCHLSESRKHGKAGG
ncbi:DMT family transporter [Leeia sp. TBRC 13508]|uniref:DMT family transporter n=1 Tax=Leeia speluncae TaxID=2884804 RepID=A0ABS8D629_9NEIS|nr:DMT family transporter [Leeia speluncae]MCB6183078.1 DMT family transporter [Leeia speluncae]